MQKIKEFANRVNWFRVAAAVIISAVAVGVSLWAFPEWGISTRWVVALVALAIVTTTQVFADGTQAYLKPDNQQLSNEWQKPRDAKGVLYVIGTGKRKISAAEVWVAEELGSSMARGSYVLVTGGWPGVDHVISEAFYNELKKSDKRLSNYLLQIVPKWKTPDFRKAGIFSNSAHSEDEALGIRLDLSDALIAMGGQDGVSWICERAKMEQIPIFPIPITQGDAKEFFAKMLREWTPSLMGKVSKADFERVLKQPINSKDDARILVDELLNLVKESQK